MDDDSYLYLKKKIRKLTNINLDYYKNQQMRRRLDSFISRSETANIVEYCRIIQNNKDALRKLCDFITINVSEFYRDSQPFERLGTSILPKLLDRNPLLDIWSAGCSRGQEPYTIAMILESITPGKKHRILATDIDESALQTAITGGPYTSEDIKNLPVEFKNKYFTYSNEKYLVKSTLKDRVEFRQQNLLNDSFDKGFDLIICRNVTIYFTEEAKHELNFKFFNSLIDGGVLFIGSTEVMLDATKIGFVPMGVSFYQKPEQPQDKRSTVKEKTPVAV